MRKKRVLMVTEASYLNTGYATYARHILDGLYSSGKYEVAEFSIYGHAKDPLRKKIKWKTYANMPDPDRQDHIKAYNSNITNQFGAWRFERVCLDFEPDIVLTIRDFWMDSFIHSSPFKGIFKTAWMPTVDAAPQNEEWIDIYASTDYVLTYSEWASKVLKSQGGDSINLRGAASPCAPKECIPKDKKECRKELGIPEGINLIGTVMRNQRRKLFPVLIESFGKYLKKSGDRNTYLYCHTSYPDAGWNLAQLLHDHEVSSRVLMSYVCEQCKALEVCHFNDARKQCTSCGKFSSTPSSVANGVNDLVLSKIYNSMDLYIQVANSEGWGCPIIEAAACGVKVACTAYSAMEDFINKLKAYPIMLSDTYKELETGCERAVPNKESVIDIFQNFFLKSEEEKQRLSQETRDLYIENYGWDKTVKCWSDIIDECPYSDWKAEPQVLQVADIPIDQESTREFVDDLCLAYIPNPEDRDSFFTSSLIRDLNRGVTRINFDGYFGQESGPLSDHQMRSIDRPMVKTFMMNRLKNHILWETARVNRSMLKDGDEQWLN